MKRLLVYLFLLCGCAASAQPAVYPLNWWVGMKNPSLQLMLHGSSIASKGQPVIQYPGVRVVKISRVKNPNYLFIDLQISASAKPGQFDIRFPGDAGSTIRYSLKARSSRKTPGVTAEDLVYLIMPDRFANGDTTNDRIPGMRDQSLNRSDYFARHGGDLKGIENHLDYLEDLGVTALWLMPVLKNDMPSRSEHGYAFTDHYSIEPRFGGAEAYTSLVTAMHKRKMKIVQDAVYNHVGIEHFLYRDLPDSGFFHFWPKYTNTSYKDPVLMDPYASRADRAIMSNGWFTPSMPDVNQQNPFFANYLIQHAIWCTENFSLDGWRIDTYAYNDLDFMNRCNKALLDEFPTLGIFAETWVHGIPNQSFFSKNVYTIPFQSNLPGVTDFQLNLYGILPALTQATGWTEGVNRLYLTATNDFVYKDPMKNVIFLDNHDVSRFYSMVGEDMQKLKMGIAWLMTFRGIPQLYYGTEILMKNYANPDGLVRLDFVGGWPGDWQNRFTEAGRSAQENEIFNYTRSLAQFRKNSPAIKTGALMQYVPQESLYVYFRYSKEQTVMCMMNAGDAAVTVDMSRFIERTAGFKKARDVVTGAVSTLGDSITVPGKTLAVYELQKN